MNGSVMDLHRLEEMIAVHGGRRDRWPAAEREAAVALLQRSEAARSLLDEVLALDRLLDSVPALEPTPATRAAILASAPRVVAPSLAQRLGDGWRTFLDEIGGWRMGSVLASSLVLGAVVSGFLSGSTPASAEPDLLQLAQFDDNFAGFVQ